MKIGDYLLRHHATVDLPNDDELRDTRKTNKYTTVCHAHRDMSQVHRTQGCSRPTYEQTHNITHHYQTDYNVMQ